MAQGYLGGDSRARGANGGEFGGAVAPGLRAGPPAISWPLTMNDRLINLLNLNDGLIN